MTSSTEIICQECDNAFAYTDVEREFRESRGLTRPLICPDCRGKERARRNGDLVALYQRADSFDPFIVSGDTQGNGRQHKERGPRQQQYTTTCAACGSETRVPFIPRGDRPVYCRSCYNARRGR
jgi:CxxC-x17-CxxC domain-containing protein